MSEEISLLKILNHTRKSELVSECRSLVVPYRELANFIISVGMGLIPNLLHMHVFREIVPEHLELKEEDHLAISKNGVGKLSKGTSKAVRKISALFEERKQLAGHMFFDAQIKRWWFVHFSLRELQDKGNHWKEGAHMHLVCWLTHPNVEPDKFIEEYATSPNPNIDGRIHIKTDSMEDRYKDS